EGAERPRGLSPAGYEVGGLCFLDGLGRALLERRLDQARLLIVEGAPDFLTASLSFGEANDTIAVASILSGSWTPAFANALPPFTEITIATHEDQAGEQFARTITQTIKRGTQVSRWRYQDERSAEPTQEE